MTEDFEDFDPSPADFAPQGEAEPLTPYERDLGSRITTAAALTHDEFEPADLGFEPDNRYLTFEILGEQDWPTITSHQIWKTRFYVASPRGTVGVVPWAGSRVIWPWERAWGTDLHRAEVESFLKEDEKKAKRK